MLQSYDAWPDAFGRLARVVDGSGVRELHYDAFGKTSRLELTPAPHVLAHAVGLPHRYTVDMAFDRRGQLLTAAVTGIAAIGAVDLGSHEYRYDDLGRPVQVSSRGVGGAVTLAHSPAWDADARLSAVSLGNAVRATWRHDAATRALREIDYLAGIHSIGRVEYPTIDANGNIESEVRWSGGTTTPQTSKQHRYDAQDRLVWSELTTQAQGTRASDFEYSAAGNITRTTQDKYLYEDPLNVQAVTHVEANGGQLIRKLSYDLDGWLEHESRTDHQLGRVEERELTFDASGCLVGVDVEVRGAQGQLLVDRQTEHVCGPDNTRVLRSTHDRLTGARQTVLDLPGIGEIRPNDGLLVRRLDLGGTVFVEEARDLSSGARITAESGYVLNDARGSVLARTSFAAPGTTITREAEYDAWGGPLSLGATPLPRYGFAGAEADPGDGYLHFGRRVYDPSLRRWLSPDPLLLATPELDVGDGRQLNLYAYAANNPVTHTDPTGTFAFVIPALVVIVASKVGTSVAVGGTAAVLLSVGVGLADPNPAGSLDLPGPGDNLGRATRAAVGEAAVRLADDAAKAGSRLADDALKVGDDIIARARGLVDDVAAHARSLVDDASQGAKRGPKTDPAAPHNAKIRAEAEALEGSGNKIVAGGGKRKEQLIETRGGHKTGRRPDILYETPDGSLRGRNVGRTRADGSPVKREAEALEDLNGPGGLPTDFVPYDR